MNKTVKCECGYEYELEPGGEDWGSCPDCDLPYKHIRKSKWISVKDRLPDIDNEVLAFTGGCCCVAWIEDGNWILNPDGWDSIKFPVTHWQPLPDPPEE